MSTVDSGNTAWVLASAALVMFMTPGLAFFYAGMVRPKNVMSVLMQNYVTIGLVSVIWVVISYSLAFGVDWGGNGIIGTAHFVGLGNMAEVIPGYTGAAAQTIPPLVFVVFQMMFAIITPALFTGTIAERMRFGPFILLILAWSILVYAPVAHWIFSPGGWLFEKGALDFAGGTVVHMNAGAAGLALALVLGKRKGYPKTGPANNLPLVVLGAGILWFGWFGFNAGSALGANALAGWAFINTNTAAAAALLAWIATERVRGGKPSGLGASCGLVAGLVAITPAAGFVNPVGAIIIGLLAGSLCCLACDLKNKVGLDDALDIFGVHFVGGLLGSLAIGFLGTTTVNAAGRNGLFSGGGTDLLWDQLLAVVAVGLYSFVATFIIAKVIDLVVGLRLPDSEEETGLDLSLHGEVAYDFIDGPVPNADYQTDRTGRQS